MESGVNNTTLPRNESSDYQAPYLVITDNQVSDSQLTTSLWLNALLGFICFVAFCILQRSVFPKHYRYRLASNNMTMKPDELKTDGWASLWDWLVKAIHTPDDKMLRDVGLDAMVMVKALSMGIIIFAPLAVIGCGVLLPLHYSYRAIDDHDINRSQLMQLTIAALPRGSNLMWVHFVLMVLYNVWVMYVMFVRYQEFVKCRQHYLHKGDDPNYWMGLTQLAEADRLSRNVRQLLAENAENKRKKDDGDSDNNQLPPPPPAPTCASPQPLVRGSAQSSTTLARLGNRMQKSWNMFSSWKSKSNLLPFQRNSFDSYKPYTDESTPAGSPPVMSPQASSLGGGPPQGWGLSRGRDGGAGGVSGNSCSSSDGLESGGEGSVGEGLGTGSAAAAAGGSVGGMALGSSAGGVDSSVGTAAGAGGSLSGGSSRRWSDSSGGGSESGGVAALRGLEGGGGGEVSRRLRLPGKAAAKASRPPVAVGGGTPPTHQTISELHSMPLQVPASTLHDQPWPALMPKHMRTITEDSLEYRLDSSQGNTSRPSSRGGVLGSIGHNRASSGGTGDLSAASPSSIGNHCRTPTSALSASIAAAAGAAAGDSSSAGSSHHSHRHSHSNSGGSGCAGNPASGGAGVTPSPLSRASSSQPPMGSSPPARGGSAGLSSLQQQQQQQGSPGPHGALTDLTGRGSVDSLGPSSVCTRITHNSSSGRSSPDDPSYHSSTEASSRHSSPVAGQGSVRSSTPDTAATDTASFISGGSAAARDLSFGGMAALQAAGGARLEGGGAQALGISPDQVMLGGLGDAETPAPSPAAAAAGGSRHGHHGYESSVDFTAMHLEDLSRPETPLSPEDGGFTSPEPIQSRLRRTTTGSGGGRWSPFASCEQIASTIAAEGVAGGEDPWSGGVQRVQGVQSTPTAAFSEAGAAAGGAVADGMQQGVSQGGSSSSSKQRFLRPGPGWHTPSAGGGVQHLDAPGSSAYSGSEEQQQQQQRQHHKGHHQQQQQSRQGAAGPSETPAAAGAGSSCGKGIRAAQEPGAPGQQQPPAAAGKGGMFSSARGSARGSESSSSGPTRAGSNNGVQGRPQRPRVLPYNSVSSAGGTSGPSGRNSSEPSPSQQQSSWHSSWQQASWQQQGSRGTGSSAATSSNGQSRQVSPFASLHVTPRETQAVAGAAIGAGQELTAAAVAAAAAAAGPVGDNVAVPSEGLQRMMLDEEEAFGQHMDDSRRVAYHWWKELPADSVRKCDIGEDPGGGDGEAPGNRNLQQVCQQWAGENKLLAKPSVRFRKTVSFWDEEADRFKAVNAQHYAVLVTDVQQWPYPELQWAHEIARRQTFYYKAWHWLGNVLSKVPQSLSWNLAYDKFLQQPHEQQLLLVRQDGGGPSDKHSFEIPLPPCCPAAAAAPDAVAGSAAGVAAAAVGAAAGTLGGAFAPTVRASRGQQAAGRGQLSSCATSSEGIGGGGGLGGGNPLARVSIASHTSHLSNLPGDLDDFFSCMVDELDLLRQKTVEESATNPQEAERMMAKIEKRQMQLARMMQERERHQALSREHSYLHLPAGRSYIRLGAAGGYTGGAGGVAGGAGGAAALVTASRASSFRSSKHARADNAVAGAAVGVPEFSHKPLHIGVLPPMSRAHTPASLHASSDAGSFAGMAGAAAGAGVAGAAPLTLDRIDSALVLHAQQQQQQQRQSSLRMQRVHEGSPRLLEANDGDVPLHMYGAAGSAAGIGGEAGSVLGRSAGGQPAIEQVLSEPLITSGGSRMLQQQLSQPAAHQMDIGRAQSSPAGDAAAALVPLSPTAAAAAAAVAASEAAAGTAGSSGSHGHGMLLGELSLEQPLLGGAGADSAGGVGSSSTVAGSAAAAVARHSAAAAAAAAAALNSQESVSSPAPAAATAADGGAAGIRVAGSTAAVDGADTCPAAPGAASVYPVPHHHRRYVYRSNTLPAGASSGRHREGDLPSTPSPSSGIDSGDRAQWSSAPPTPTPGDGGAHAGGGQAATAGAAEQQRAAGRSTGGGAFAGVVGVSDSYESNASSYAARRPVVTFKPYPPDSPKAAQQQQQQQQLQTLSMPSQREMMAHMGLRSPAAGAAVGARAVRSFVSSGDSSEHALASRLASFPAANSSRQLSSGVGGAGASHGSSGGGAGATAGAAVSSGGGSGPYAMHHVSLQAAGHSRSARRCSSSQAEGCGHSFAPSPPLSLYHPDHLSLMIPPVQQVPISRVGTPCGSGGGFGGSGGGVGGCGGSLTAVTVPPQPWGLPPDAALLTSSLSFVGSGVCSPGDLMMMNGGMGGAGAGAGASSSRRGGLGGPPHLLHRWSGPGGGQGGTAGVAGAGSLSERSAGNLRSLAQLDSPFHAVQEGGLIPAIGGGGGGGFSRAASGTGSEVPGGMIGGSWRVWKDGAAGARVDLFGLPGGNGPARWGPNGEYPIKYRSWRLVRKAYRNRTLRNMPASQSYDVVSSTFKRLFPNDYDRAIPVINHKQVDTLLMQWEAAVAEKERAELKRLRTGREPTRFKGRLGPLLSCCASAGCGCAGCRGRTQVLGSCCEDHVVEIIPEIEDRIVDLEERIEAARREAFNSHFTPSWFVLFKSQQAAVMAASTHIYAEDNTMFQVHPAPGPEEVNWQHLWMTWRERDCRTALTWPLMLAVVLFPITLITSAASRLDYVFCPAVEAGQPVPAFVWEWYCTGKEVGSSVPSFLRAFITGWLPSLLLNLWLVMVLPRLVYLLVQSEGSCFSLSALERRIGAVFFYWDIFNVFLQGTIGSTFFQQVRHIIQSPEQLPNILGAALPDSSNFFMQFIAMRALFLIWLRMCVPHGGVWQNWCHYCWCPSCCCSTCNTDRDQSLTYGPRTPRYGFEMGHMLLMYLIALAFAIVSPLLLPFSVVWFAFAYVAWRHNLNYVYQRKYESGGMMWIFLFSRIVMCLVIGQLFTFCVLVVRGAYWQAFLTIAFMPALTARYYKYCQARFARGVEFGVPLDTAQQAPRVSVPTFLYIPPPLQTSSFGWYPEWNKIWDGWGMPAYSL